VPDAWSDIRDVFTTPPSVWNGTAYSLDTATNKDGILSEPPLDYPFYTSAGCILAAHVAWTTAQPDVGEFTVKLTGGSGADAVLVDEFLAGTSGEFDFSYTFDGTEFGTVDNPDGYTAVQIEMLGGALGESGTDATAVVSPQTQPGPPAAVILDKRIIELRTSKDGAHNWSYWRQHDMGAQGNFKDRPLFRRLGFGRRIVMHVRASGNFGRDLVACSIDTEPF
jgi:hypothetical protein